MKIVFYGSSYPPAPYGASRYVDNLSRVLAQRGHSVTVVTARVAGRPDTEERDGVRVVRLCDAGDMRTLGAAEAVVRLAAEARVDLIQGVEYLGECAPVLAQPGRPPVCIKVISSVSMRVLRRSLAHYAWQKPLVALASLRAWRQWRAETACIRGADMLFAATQRVFDELQKQEHRLPAVRAVIPNPVALPSTWQKTESAHPAILFVGRLDFGKGVGYLPGMLKSVAATVKDVELIVAGGDSYARGLGSLKGWLVRQFGGLIGHVSFLGEVGHGDLDECYRRAWVVIVPSRWDSCSNVTLEAMARATPVVCSPHGGMPELVATTGAPIADPATSEFARVVVGLLSDASRRVRLGALLQARALAMYGVDTAADLYERFVSAHCG